MMVNNGGMDWKDVIAGDIWCWLAVYIYMGLKKLPNNCLYWDRCNFFGCPLAKAAIRRRRFEQICRIIYLVDNSTLITDKRNPAYDKIAKVRWLVEEFIKINKHLYNCDHHVCVEEIMISY